MQMLITEIVVVDIIFLSSVRNCKMSKNVRKPSEIVAVLQGRSDVLTCLHTPEFSTILFVELLVLYPVCVSRRFFSRLFIKQ